MSQADTAVARGQSQLKRLPVGLFGSVMGLTGVAAAHARYGGPEWLWLATPGIGILI